LKQLAGQELGDIVSKAKGEKKIFRDSPAFTRFQMRFFNSFANVAGGVVSHKWISIKAMCPMLREQIVKEQVRYIFKI
jgi:hypothetical protein